MKKEQEILYKWACNNNADLSNTIFTKKDVLQDSYYCVRDDNDYFKEINYQTVEDIEREFEMLKEFSRLPESEKVKKCILISCMKNKRAVCDKEEKVSVNGKKLSEYRYEF